jgi:hypothetical protein
MIGVYSENGTSLGLYNTSSLVPINESVVIHLSSNRTRDYISEPMILVEDIVFYTRDNLLAIIIICLIAGFLVVRL